MSIVLGSYTLHAIGLRVKGRPTWEENLGVGEFIKQSVRRSRWWLADWLRYTESRADWADRLSQAFDMSGLARHTLENIRSIGAIEVSRRREDVDFSLHEIVAALEPAEQSAWLERAATEGWTQREFRMEVRAAHRRKVLEGQAVLQGRYRVIYADPPWLYADAGATADGSLQKAERHYRGMSIADLCALPIAAHAMPDAVLFLWVTAPMLLTNPGPREVIEAWGFEYKTGAVWDKVLGTWGHYFHVRHEHLLVCTRGSCTPDHPTPQPDSVLTERRSNEHSRKPTIVRRVIEQLYDGPRVELFASERAEGWTSFGNDARLWGSSVEAV